MAETRPWKKIEKFDKKILNTSGIVKKTAYNTKITEFETKTRSIAIDTHATETENKIPDFNNPAIKTALNTISTEAESKTPDITNLATKAALIVISTEIENKTADPTGFISIAEFNRLIKISFGWGMKGAAKCLASRCQVDDAFDRAGKNRVKKLKILNILFKLF